MSERFDSVAGTRSARMVSLLVAGLMLATSQLAFADIRETKHNLARLPGQNDLDVDAKEVCIYCHFPRVGEAGIDASPAGGPKWQSSVSEHQYDIYDDNGRVDIATERRVGSPSIACLSCHDANQALAVTHDKRGDHPFGVPYPGARQSVALLDDNRRKALAAGMPARFAAPAMEPEGFRPALETTLGSRRIFWASARGGNSLRRGKEDLPLFGRSMADSGETVPFVECSSCHDPHASRNLFLRVANDSGALCMTCHQK